jgi:hypothetical protein
MGSPNETINEVTVTTEITREEGNRMPFDRGGNPIEPIERKKLSEIRAEEKEQKRKQREAEQVQQLLAQPVTKRDFQRAMFNVFGSLEKVVAEFRKLAVRNEALQSLLLEQGTITKDDYERFAIEQSQWNQQIDEIINAYETTPLNEVVKIVNAWNATHERLQIGWQHIDLAPRLLNSETLTLEEKLQIAADMQMPDPFIDELRKQNIGNFAAEAAEAFGTALSTPEAVPATEEQAN